MSPNDDALTFLVVDDHALIRQGLGPLLEDLAGQVRVLEAGDMAGATALLARHPEIDLVLLDLHLPDTAGLSAVDCLRAQHPDVPVVVLSGACDRPTVLGAFERGAAGFIPKSTAPAVMAAALQVVLAGGLYVPPESTVQAQTWMPDAPPAPGGPAEVPPEVVARAGLTGRQADVLALMLQGKPNKVISRELGLALGTVKNHVAAILRAFDASSRTQVVIAVRQAGAGRPGPRG